MSNCTWCTISGRHMEMSFLSFFAKALCLSQFSNSYFCPTCTQHTHMWRTYILPAVTTTTTTGDLELEDFASAKFYCPYGLADGNLCIWIREKTLEFSSTLLSTLSPYCTGHSTCSNPVLSQVVTNFHFSCATVLKLHSTGKSAWNTMTVMYLLHACHKAIKYKVNDTNCHLTYLTSIIQSLHPYTSSRHLQGGPKNGATDSWP